jgi:hypothetical protein
MAVGSHMNQQAHDILHKFRFLVAGFYVVICLFLLSLLLSAITGGSAGTGQAWAAADPSSTTIPVSDGPNVVSNGMSMTLYNAENTANSFQAGFMNTTHDVASAVASSGENFTKTTAAAWRGTTHGVGTVVFGIGHGFRTVGLGISHGFAVGGRGIGHGFAFVGIGVARSFAFVFGLPIHVMSSVANSAPVGAVIRPADHDPVQVIDPSSPELAKARIALATPAPATPSQPVPVQPVAIWPIHGEITTQFGEPEPPYQPIHTGIDISDGKPSGVTPIKAFRKGKVIDVERGGGLGNHVVIDHGSGVTSVYGHLYSIAVAVGQEVDTTTTIGTEGTTGVSTGPHLHFEIRVNGQATDPHQFIAGQPF